MCHAAEHAIGRVSCQARGVKHLARMVPLLLSATAVAAPDDDRVLAAIAKRDAAALEKLGPRGIELTSIGWDDPACAKQFGGKKVVVGHGEMRALVDCLAKLDPHAGPRGLVFEPGGVIVAVAGTDGTLMLVSASGGTPAAPLLPEDLVLTVEPPPETRAAIERSATEVAWAHVVVCFDATGHAEAPVIEASSHVVGYDKAVIAAAAKLVHTPFKAHGKAARACLGGFTQYPKDRPRPNPDGPPKPVVAITPKKVKVKDIVQPVKIQKEEPRRAEDENGVEGGVEGGTVGGDLPPPPPPPPPPPRNVPPTELERNRVAGVKEIAPDAETRAKMIADKKAKVVGSWKLCLDREGTPTTVLVLKSTGYKAYDDAIAAGVRGWRYKPYTVDGRAVAVCTAVTFIYAAQ